MSLIRRIGKGLNAFSKEITKPESFEKGETFEAYVRKVLFPNSDFKLVHKTHDFASNNGDYVETSLKPDFKFRDQKNNREFFVEVKWRAGVYNYQNKIDWCNKSQLKRYKAIDKNEAKVFIVLGIGDNPSKPHEIAIFPISSCNFTSLYDSFINKYVFFVDKPVFSGYLWKLR